MTVNNPSEKLALLTSTSHNIWNKEKITIPCKQELCLTKQQLVHGKFSNLRPILLRQIFVRSREMKNGINPFQWELKDSSWSLRSPQTWVWFDRNWCNQNGVSEFGHAEYGWVFSKEDARSFFFFQLLGTLFESFYKYSSPKKNKTKPVETFPNLVTNSRRESKNLKCLMFAKKFYILKQISSFQRWATGWFKYMWTFSEQQALKG